MRKDLYIKHSLAMLALVGLLCLGPSAGAQVSTAPPDRQATTPPAATGDGDITNGELANMDRFLDRHPEIAERLHKNPSLVNNREFVEDHQALQQFLQDHPMVRQELRENPNAFLGQEDRYDRQENNGDRDRTRGEMASMDRFLDRHPEIAEQLRKKPSLVNNREFIENHPALQAYLQDHPEVREEMRENPNAFMRQEDRYDRREDSRDPQSATGMGDRDRRDPATTAGDRDPATGVGERNRKQSATGVGERDRSESAATGVGDRDSATGFGDRENRATTTTRDNRASTTHFGEFLQSHSTVGAELSKNPSLANNKEYMATHPELQDYLKDHPETQRQLSANPQAFMRSVPFTSPPATKGPTTVPNPKENH